MREASRTQHAEEIVFVIPLTTCNLPMASKRIFEILLLSNPQFSKWKHGEIARLFLCTQMPPLACKTRCSLRGLRLCGCRALAISPVDIGESEDLLSDEDLVQGYMDQPFHNWVTEPRGKGQVTGWREVDTIFSGSYDRDAFARRVLDHMSGQDEPVGGNPPTYCDLFRSKARDGPMGTLGRPPEPKTSGVATPQVSLVVQVPGKAKAESGESPKIRTLRARLKSKYGDTFFSGKPMYPLPFRVLYDEAKIRLKPDPCVYRHQEFALWGERKAAMKEILTEFID